MQDQLSLTQNIITLNLHFFCKNPLYKNRKAQQNAENLEVFKNHVKAPSEFPYFHHIISLILSVPVYYPLKIRNFSYQDFWN